MLPLLTRVSVTVITSDTVSHPSSYLPTRHLSVRLPVYHLATYIISTPLCPSACLPWERTAQEDKDLLVHSCTPSI